MKCRKAERWTLLSLDGRLAPDREKKLSEHAEHCPHCRKIRDDYRVILSSLRQEDREAEPLPYFWERLEPRIVKEPKAEPWTIWLKWSYRAIPVSLALIALFLVAIAFLAPAASDNLSGPEALLLGNANPVAETQTLFNEQKTENRNMMIIFAADDRIPGRRYGP
jgi:predicted anti-sigma-YlaC factor YlaD